MTQNFEIKARTSKVFKLHDTHLAYDVVMSDSTDVPKTKILLLINGFQRTRLDFRALRQKLKIECPDTITIAFDNRFCGETKVLKNAEDTSLQDFALDALALLKHYKDEFKISHVSVLGISMGGMIAQILTNLPDCPQLQNLFLVSTTAGGDNRVWPTADILNEKHLGADLSHEVISKRLAFYFGAKFLKNSPLLFKMFITNMEKTLKSEEAQKSTKKQAEASKNFEGIKDFKNYSAKNTIIISGDEDNILPVENSYILSKLIPNSQLIIYPQVGHLILIENSLQFLKDIVKFLTIKDTVVE